MAQARKILIADPDLDSVRSLSKALRLKGYQVHYAPDGSKALEVAVLRHPDLTLFDERCTLVDARTFLQILRTNPRTDDIPVVLTTDRFDSERMRVFRDGFLRKPFNIDEVLARIDHLLRRSEAAKELRGETKEIEGSLSQLGIPDLMQILAMNRRTGRLTLERGNERGEIHVADGRPINAMVGSIEGEKALFRLIGWAEGTFAFVPGHVSNRVLIQRTMEDALLEGVRQSDEIARLLPSLPPRHVRVALVPELELSTDQHPVTAQVVEVLRQPRTLGEVLDLVAANDLDAMVVLSTLMNKGMARIAASSEEGHGPLLGPAQIHALRARVFRGRPTGRMAVAKVFIIGEGQSAARRVLSELTGLLPVAADPAALHSGFGTLGRMEVSESLAIDFCVLPTAEAARPLWRPFSYGAVGGLLLETSEAAVRLAHYFGFDLRVPVVVAGHEVPKGLEGCPAGSAAVGQSIVEALRALLIQALNPLQPDPIIPATKTTTVRAALPAAEAVGPS